MTAAQTRSTVNTLKASGEDFEWYPTNARMISAVLGYIGTNAKSIMDIGAGDGRVLKALGAKCEQADLYSIEKSPKLMQAQPRHIIPVGTEFYEQNLSCLPVDYIFCNPPYSQFEQWAAIIIEHGFAKSAFLILPQRWKDSKGIAKALKRRGATAHVIGSDHFHDAERQARAVVDILRVSFPSDRWGDKPKDPFDIWFDQNIDTFDADEEADEPEASSELAKAKRADTIADMVEAHDEEMNRLENNYRAIFQLDLAILRELGVNKDAVREGIKVKMAGLKSKYWGLMFERLDAITKRLCTKTKERFLDKLTKRSSVAFTTSNAYAVVIWAIKNANQYYDEQLVDLFKELSTCDSAVRYKSNTRTWEKDGWRWRNDNDYTHYALDYRFIVSGWKAIFSGGYGGYEYPGNLHRNSHATLDDIRAVLYNLGFEIDAEPGDEDNPKAYDATPSRDREWESGKRQEFYDSTGKIVLDVRAFLNSNLHFRFRPEAIRAINIEAGRLLGWIRSVDEAVDQLGYDRDEVERVFGSNLRILPSNIKLLTAKE